MDSSPFAPMKPSSEGPNPLRPYYKPPSIGSPIESSVNSTANNAPTRPQVQSYGSSARNILSDIDYNEFLGEAGPTTGESIKSVFDQLIWKYTSVFMAQPFEVARTVLQCLDAGHLVVAEELRHKALGKRKANSAAGRSGWSQSHPSESEEDSGDEPSYFTSTAPQYSGVTRPPRYKQDIHQRSPSDSSRRSSTSPLGDPPPPSHRLSLRKSDSLLEVLSQLWQREGSWGVWKGTNTTFLYSLALKTIETWTRSLFSAVLNLPDPGSLSSAVGSATTGGLDIIDSPSPLASLGTAVAAACVGGLILAPVDIVRTRLLITPTVQKPRSILPSLQLLPTWTCPSTLLGPTLLHAILPPLFSASTPLLLRSSLRIDPIITPMTYSVCTFLSSTVELFLRLPVETVLRRAQASFILCPPSPASPRSRRSRQSRLSRSRRRDSDSTVDPYKETAPEGANEDVKTVVRLGAYRGVLGTLWHIAREEGESNDPTAGAVQRHSTPGTTKQKRRKGQGVHGLWRGWRVGWWGLVGVWGAATLGGAGGKGGEF